MNMNEGQTPEEIVESIKIEEAQRTSGRLKIFLGMAAGVGKTYAMLENAKNLIKEQVDIVVGSIETHERKELDALLEDLPQIPKKTLVYKDKEFAELNVEMIISLKPNVVIVDELAHSNVSGSKNEKRWQDVLEFLAHGISVHTTLNIQHIESLNEIIFNLTGALVKETVPDLIIEKASSIQLIDITPDELLARLNDGKIYGEEQSKIATRHFFQKNKLAALREILFQYISDKVDSDLMMISTKEGIIGWKTREKFLVALNENPKSQKLIKVANKLAIQANASWLGCYVQTSQTLEAKDAETLEKFKSQIEAFGAELIIVYDPDIAQGIKKIAYQRNITQIILGETSKRTLFPFFQGPTLLNKLEAECLNSDLRVVRENIRLKEV